MSKVQILKGLPASGKTTYAKELEKDGWIRVEKDEIRKDSSLFKDGVYNHNRGDEKIVLRERDRLIKDALTSGKDVVSSDTNLNPAHEADIKKLVQPFNAEVEVVYFDTPLDVCIDRDKIRENSVGKKVILGMYNQYVKPAEIKAIEEAREANRYVAPAGVPKALIVDIDGTLAHMKNRSPYDYRKAIEDDHDEAIREIVTRYAEAGYVIIICSGREDDCRDVTEQWLSNKDIPYYLLLMRKAGDKRKDSIVKKEIFDNNIRDKYDIHFVLDDRDQVIKMWRHELGLKTLQVEYGNF